MIALCLSLRGYADILMVSHLERDMKVCKQGSCNSRARLITMMPFVFCVCMLVLLWYFAPQRFRVRVVGMQATKKSQNFYIIDLFTGAHISKRFHKRRCAGLCECCIHHMAMNLMMATCLCQMRVDAYLKLRRASTQIVGVMMYCRSVYPCSCALVAQSVPLDVHLHTYLFARSSQGRYMLTRTCI